jgi:hypothetical protein
VDRYGRAEPQCCRSLPLVKLGAPNKDCDAISDERCARERRARLAPIEGLVGGGGVDKSQHRLVMAGVRVVEVDLRELAALERSDNGFAMLTVECLDD